MPLLKNLWLVCALAGLAIITHQPARAQSDGACVGDANNLGIKPEVILDCLRAGQSVTLDGVTVEGDLDLTSLRTDSQQGILVPRTLAITNSHFSGSLISFNGDQESVLIFQEQVDLRGSQFTGSVDFTGATFEEFAHFENTHFKSGANFTQATFQNGAFFHSSIFDHSTSFMLASISGGIDFSGAQFFELANFSMLRSIQSPEPLLRADISFSGAHFSGAVYFMDAVIENPVLFNDAVFRRISPEDAVQFTNATFTTLNLTNANFESGQLDLSDQQYEVFMMPNFHPSILTSQNSIEGLSGLKNNFLEQGSLDIANDISYWQNVVQRREKPITVQIVETIFLDWTFGYGFKPLHSVRMSVLLILFFAIFYYPAGTLRATTFAPSKPREWKFTIRLAEIPIAPDEEAVDIQEKNHRSRPLPPQFLQAWQAITFSLGVFTKLGSGKYVAVRASYLVIAEWIIGLMMMAGFLFSLANTNPLLRSVLDLFK
jgi:uncharacterized protein YjbI with pentapeptide repeats